MLRATRVLGIARVVTLKRTLHISKPLPCTQFDTDAGKTISYLKMKTIISSKGQIVLPAEFRRLDRIEPGQEFDVERIDRGDYRLRRAVPQNEGAIAWLLSCPYKDFFVPIDSESTDTL